jgi:hypothetical protein
MMAKLWYKFTVWFYDTGSFFLYLVCMITFWLALMYCTVQFGNFVNNLAIDLHVVAEDIRNAD